jgi:hypothetical protein
MDVQSAGLLPVKIFPVALRFAGSSEYVIIPHYALLQQGVSLLKNWIPVGRLG